MPGLQTAVGAGVWGGGSGSKGGQSGGGKEGGLAGDGEGEGVGEGRAQAGGGMVGDGDHAAVLAQTASVKKTQPAFQMHRPERGMEPVERLGCRVCWAA